MPRISKGSLNTILALTAAVVIYAIYSAIHKQGRRDGYGAAMSSVKEWGSLRGAES